MISTASLLESLLPLLPPSRTSEAESLGASHGAARLVAELVRRSWLTKYQAKELCKGRGPALRFGNFVVLDRLGAGGMGEVHRARHVAMDRVVALKRMRTDLGQPRTLIDRFRREAKAAARLSHPNIVQAYDAGEVERVHYLSMELLSGSDLAAVLARQGWLPVAEAVDHVRQACEGMQHAFEQGIVHRDLKPHNLWLTPSGQVKVLDLGLALMRTGTVLTTPGGSPGGSFDYMPPEQFSDFGGVDTRADVFALGCTLYHLLTGRPPRAVMSPPPAIEGVRPEVPGEVANVVRKMMARTPEERYRTPGEAAEALAATVRAATSEAVPASVVPDTVRPAGAGLPERFVNGIGMKFVRVEAGTFLMGSPEGEAGREENEHQHEVRLTKAFWLGVHVVTVGQWKRVAAGYKTDAERGDGADGWTGSTWEKAAKYNWKSPGFAQGDDHPVTCVSWVDAVAFCEWLKKECPGHLYRLPTETEWEYSCRGGPVNNCSPFHFKQPQSSLSSTQANFDGSSPYGDAAKGPYLQCTTPVGSFEANALGLFDMHGNVWEWCLDWDGDYPDGPVTNPSGPSQGEGRVQRGGSWYDFGRYCRTAYRARGTLEGRGCNLGFRVAVTAE